MSLSDIIQYKVYCVTYLYTYHIYTFYMHIFVIVQEVGVALLIMKHIWIRHDSIGNASMCWLFHGVHFLERCVLLAMVLGI